MSVGTQTFKIGIEVYCSYCGEKAKEDWSWNNHRPAKQYFYCDCDNAKKEIDFHKESLKINREAEIKISELERSLPKVNQEMINERQYEFELSNLKKKYKIK
ncbi:hypothetical protein Goe21_00840 [Bacillus phage vB_BsuM-Goe21]|nr:hypothetical protein Goe21_00840 [Bacillus phage vB_BsuM-Goe21]